MAGLLLFIELKKAAAAGPPLLCGTYDTAVTIYGICGTVAKQSLPCYGSRDPAMTGPSLSIGPRSLMWLGHWLGHHYLGSLGALVTDMAGPLSFMELEILMSLGH